MEIASLILSVIAVLMSGASLIWMLAKHMSTHTIQYVDPFQKSMDNIATMGKDPLEQFRDIEDKEVEK